MSARGGLPPLHLLLALGVMAVWGTNFVVIKLALAHLPPLTLATLRFSLAFLPMALLLISGLLMLLYPITRTRHVAIRRVLDRRLVAMSGGDECPIGQAGALHFAQNPKD